MVRQIRLIVVSIDQGRSGEIQHLKGRLSAHHLPVVVSDSRPYAKPVFQEQGGTRMTEATENGIEPLAGRGVLRVMLRGLDQEDPVKLLEDTARFLRDQGRSILDGRDPGEDVELMFKRVDLGDFVIVTIKS